MLEKLVVLDCNGVLIIDKGTPRISEIKIPEGVTDGLLLLAEQGFSFIVVSNMPGFGQSDLSEKMLNRYNDNLREYFREHNIEFKALISCPHPASAKCGCRKPSTTLLQMLEEKISINWESSYGIGINPSHSQMMLRKGGSACLIKTGPANNHSGISLWKDDDIEIAKLVVHENHCNELCLNFLDAVDWVMAVEMVRVGL